jgi:hypothetical protein
MRKRYFVAAVMAATLSACGAHKNDDQGSAEQSKAAEPTPVMDAAGIVKQLSAQGLKIENVVAVTEDSDSNHLLGRPGQYTSKAFFYDARHPKSADSDEGENTIEVFSNPDDAKKRHDYIAKVTDGVPFLLQYQFLRGSVLLRLDHIATPSEAKEYELALAKVIGG